MSRLAGLLLLALSCIGIGCGYHTAGHDVQLPTDVHTVAIPEFANSTQTYHVDQVLTAAVVREFISRTHYHITSNTDQPSDATLHGTVVSAYFVPVTYDTRTGRVATVLAVVGMKITLTDRNQKVLYQNPAFVFRDEYELATDPASFFEEKSPTLDRISQQLARMLVTDILEAY